MPMTVSLYTATELAGDDLLFTTSNEVTPAGAPVWKLNALRGWYNTTFATPIAEYGVGNGGAVGTTTRRGRHMSLEMTVYGGDASETVRDAWQMINALPTDNMVMRVTDYSVPDEPVKWTWVRVEEGVEVEPITKTSARVRIRLYAFDARKFGLTPQSIVVNVGSYTTAVAASLSNEGTAPAPVWMSLTGSSVPSTRWPIRVARTSTEYFEYGTDYAAALSKAVWITDHHGGVILTSTPSTPSPARLTTYAGLWPSIPAGASRTITVTMGASGASSAQVTALVYPAWW